MAEFTPAVGHLTAVKTHREFAAIGIDRFRPAPIAVEHLLVVVVGHLHHLVAGGKAPAEALHLLGGLGRQEVEVAGGLSRQRERSWMRRFLAARIRRIALIRVVLPTPCPPVIISGLAA